jgi:transposase-like protein
VFFNQIAKNVANWDNPFCFQLHNIMTSDVLTLDGRWVMEQIGIYSKPLSDEEITKNLKVKTDETCHICKWTNVSLINLGEPNKPRWTCQGCCKRMLEENKNV